MILPTSSTLKLDHVMWKEALQRISTRVLHSQILFPRSRQIGRSIPGRDIPYRGEKPPCVMLCSAVSRTVGK